MKSIRDQSPRVLVIVGILATLVLAGLSVLSLGALGGRILASGPVSWFGSSCTVPRLPGTVVKVTLTNRGGPMMGRRDGHRSRGAMRVNADHSTVRHGTVSFLVTNRGSIIHEMVALPLAKSQSIGTRTIGGKGEIDESDSLGEAASSCADGEGEGILPGASSWVSLTLKPGRYELLCNLPGHYAAGMYSQLTVT